MCVGSKVSDVFPVVRSQSATWLCFLDDVALMTVQHAWLHARLRTVGQIFARSGRLQLSHTKTRTRSAVKPHLQRALLEVEQFVHHIINFIHAAVTTVNLLIEQWVFRGNY